MRINKYQKSVMESHQNIKKFQTKRKWSNFISTVIETLSHYGVIILFFIEMQWNSINLATITEITATLLIVETAMGYIRNIVSTLNEHSRAIASIEKEEKDMRLILEVYHQEQKKIEQSPKIDYIKLLPFSMKYTEESENDKPFELVSENEIEIKSGYVVFLVGDSGSGKSTLQNVVAQRIRLEQSTEIPATSRVSRYDEKLRLGSLSIFEELFCGEENPDLEKMQEILENLQLWKEISANCINVWTFIV